MNQRRSRPTPPAAPRPDAARARQGPPAAAPGAGGLGEAELQQLEALLDSLPASHEALDVVMVDGFLCGVLLQPRVVPEAEWLPLVVDLDRKPPPPRFPMDRLATLLRGRQDQLRAAIARRDWFDPWVYELDDEATPSETVMPWVAGFALALDSFPALLRQHEAELTEPLAAMYRHLDPDDLEDADALLEEIETLEPPVDLPEAVEDLVRGVLLIADVVHPRERPRDAGVKAAPPRRPAGGLPAKARRPPRGRG